MKTRDDWIYNYTEEDLAELLAASNAALASGKELHEITKDEYPLPTLGPKLDAIRKDVSFGKGFVLVRGASPPTAPGSTACVPSSCHCHRHRLCLPRRPLHPPLYSLSQASRWRSGHGLR